VLIDGTFSTLDDDVLELVIDVFSKELQQTGIIHIGGVGQGHRLFSTTLHLVKAPDAAPDGSAAGSQAASPEAPGAGL
jgi:hypothetical protein